MRRLPVVWPYLVVISYGRRFFSILGETKPGKGGEIQLTDALKVLAQREAVYAYDFEGKRYDLGDKLGFLEATVEFALRRPDLGGPFQAYLKKIVDTM